MIAAIGTARIMPSTPAIFSPVSTAKMVHQRVHVHRTTDDQRHHQLVLDLAQHGDT